MRFVLALSAVASCVAGLGLAACIDNVAPPPGLAVDGGPTLDAAPTVDGGGPSDDAGTGDADGGPVTTELRCALANNPGAVDLSGDAPLNGISGDRFFLVPVDETRVAVGVSTGGMSQGSPQVPITIVRIWVVDTTIGSPSPSPITIVMKDEAKILWMGKIDAKIGLFAYHAGVNNLAPAFDFTIVDPAVNGAGEKTRNVDPIPIPGDPVADCEGGTAIVLSGAEVFAVASVARTSGSFDLVAMSLDTAAPTPGSPPRAVTPSATTVAGAPLMTGSALVRDGELVHAFYATADNSGTITPRQMVFKAVTSAVVQEKSKATGDWVIAAAPVNQDPFPLAVLHGAPLSVNATDKATFRVGRSAALDYVDLDALKGTLTAADIGLVPGSNVDVRWWFGATAPFVTTIGVPAVGPGISITAMTADGTVRINSANDGATRPLATQGAIKAARLAATKPLDAAPTVFPIAWLGGDNHAYYGKLICQ